MFKGDPPFAPKFAAGQRVHASGARIGGSEDLRDLACHFTMANGRPAPMPPAREEIDFNVAPTLKIPSNVQLMISQVKKSASDKNEHQYIVKPTEDLVWEVSESQLLGAPFKIGDKVVRKDNSAPEVEMVRETYVQILAPSAGAGESLNDDKEWCHIEFKTMISKPARAKVMLRLADELNQMSVVEAENYRLADPAKGETYFPINES